MIDVQRVSIICKGLWGTFYLKRPPLSFLFMPKIENLSAGLVVPYRDFISWALAADFWSISEFLVDMNEWQMFSR